jgi:hypothetical protein
MAGMLAVSSSFMGRLVGDVDEDNIARFILPKFTFPYKIGGINNIPIRQNIAMASLELDVDVSDKCNAILKEARLRYDPSYPQANAGTKDLSARDTAVILSAYLVSAGHVEVHATANWGLNPSSPDKWMRWYSLVSILFNFKGWMEFRRVAYIAQNLRMSTFFGLEVHSEIVEFSPQLDDRFAFVGQIKGGLTRGPGSIEAGAARLVDFSEYANFYTKCRQVFFDVLDEKVIPGYVGNNPLSEDDTVTWFEHFRSIEHDRDPSPTSFNPDTFGKEAFFYATVVHSLDHQNFERICPQATLLSVSSEMFKPFEESAQMARAGFNCDFAGERDRYFRYSQHEFYRKVYEIMAKWQHDVHMNTDFASRMQTCICR